MTEIKYAIRARNPADFSLLKCELDDEIKAHKHASLLYGNGYHVTMTRITSEQIAEWKQKDPTP